MPANLFDYETPGYRRVKSSAVQFVHAMKLGPQPGHYRKEPGGQESFYGSYHGLHILDLFGELDAFTEAELDTWADYFRENQSEHGFFTTDPDLRRRRLTLDAMEPHWHATRGHLWALRVLDRPPTFSLRFLEPLLDPKYFIAGSGDTTGAIPGQPATRCSPAARRFRAARLVRRIPG